MRDKPGPQVNWFVGIAIKDGDDPVEAARRARVRYVESTISEMKSHEELKDALDHERISLSDIWLEIERLREYEWKYKDLSD